MNEFISAFDKMPVKVARPALVLLNMAVILAVSLLAVDELRNFMLTVPGYTEWTAWTTCTKTCNSGTKYRKRFCTNPPPSLFGPPNCTIHGLGYEVTACSTNKCPINGNFGPWSQFSNCSKWCGGGEQVRVRLCINPAPQFGGRDCSSLGPYKEKNVCNEQPCPVHGGYSPWSDWGSCSKTCGDGMQERSRTCDNPVPSHNGKGCDSLGSSTDSRKCKFKDCPVNGGYGPWAEWGQCTVTCGGGTRKRERLCNIPPPKFGGNDCSSLGPSNESEKCSTKSCNVNGGYTMWSEWSSCSKSCGPAEQERRRTCTNPKPSGTGKSCKSLGLGASMEVQDCELPDCPIKQDR